MPRAKTGLLGSLNSFVRLQRVMSGMRLFLYRTLWGMDIGPGTVISSSAKLDKTHPSGIHIGGGCYIAFEAVILSHDMCRCLAADTRIGNNCFIGGRSIIW